MTTLIGRIEDYGSVDVTVTVEMTDNYYEQAREAVYDHLLQTSSVVRAAVINMDMVSERLQMGRGMARAECTFRVRYYHPTPERLALARPGRIAPSRIVTQQYGFLLPIADGMTADDINSLLTTERLIEQAYSFLDGDGIPRGRVQNLTLNRTDILDNQAFSSPHQRMLRATFDVRYVAAEVPAHARLTGEETTMARHQIEQRGEYQIVPRGASEQDFSVRTTDDFERRCEVDTQDPLSVDLWFSGDRITDLGFHHLAKIRALLAETEAIILARIQYDELRKIQEAGDIAGALAYIRKRTGMSREAAAAYLADTPHSPAPETTRPNGRVVEDPDRDFAIDE